MEEVILTPRLKLTLVSTAEPGSQELEWIHQLRSNEQSGFWSLGGPAKALSETEAVLKHMLPVVSTEDHKKIYKIPYLVHEVLPSSTDPKDSSTPETRFIGLVTLRSLRPEDTKEAPRLGWASTPTTLTLEVAYMFLPQYWGKGYATEAITEIYAACARVKGSGFWKPFEKVVARAIVNDKNKASQRVMVKCGMGKGEELRMEGHRCFVAGEWTDKHVLQIFGREIVN